MGCEQVSGGVATTPAPAPASTTASAVSTTTTTTTAAPTTAAPTTAAPTTAADTTTALTTTTASLVTYKDASCWGQGYYALCSGYKLDSTGDSVHPEASPADGVACFASCCDTAAHGAGGDAYCWDGVVTFATCCEQVVDNSGTTSPSSSSDALVNGSATGS